MAPEVPSSTVRVRACAALGSTTTGYQEKCIDIALAVEMMHYAAVPCNEERSPIAQSSPVSGGIGHWRPYVSSSQQSATNR